MTDSELTIPYATFPDGTSRAEIFEHLKSQGSTIEYDTVNWPDLYPSHRRTSVYTAHDGVCIYLLFEADDHDVRAVTDRDLGPVADDSCVEFFVCPRPETGRYWNFEFNAIGRKNVSTRVERPNPRRLSADELASIETYPSLGRDPFEQRQGACRWYLGVVIPLHILGIEYRGRTIEMTGNFYKCGGRTTAPHYITWAPVEAPRPDFHRTDSFQPIMLASEPRK